MYSIQQLQAADYLLKALTNEDEYYIKNKQSLKFVIEFSNNIWYGDFVNFKNDEAYQYQRNENGSIKQEFLNYSNDFFIHDIWDRYSSLKYHHLKISLQPKYLTVIYKELLDFMMDIESESKNSKLYPYLLNAKSLDGKYEVPFLDLKNQQIKVLSLIEITNEA